MMELNPETTWVFAVGLLEWENSDFLPSFPEAIAGRFDARLVDFFRQQGVPDEQIIYLQDEAATLEEIQSQLPEFLAKTNEEDLLIFYFTGHGGWDAESRVHYFYNYDAQDNDPETCWVVSSVFDDIEANFNGSKALILADCCYSGGIIDEVKLRDTTLAYACVSSAYARNTSTGAWTFTEALLKGLQGDPAVDLDGDRQISLYDFARYAELEVAFIEDQKSMFVTINDFDPQMQLSSVTGELDRQLEQRIEAQQDGTWYKAKITAIGEDEEIQVKYIIDDTEESITKDRIRAYQPQMFEIDRAVEARDEAGDWYPATVKKAWYGLHYISYDDFDEDWDEWVGGDRIRSID
jgi:Caspase domain/Agenet domain